MNPMARTVETARIQALRAWLIGAVVFAVTVGYRTSLGVASGDATLRFGISATELAGFTAVQLLVYLLLQVPAGVLLDRFGPRFMLACGLASMSIAQVLFALTHSFPFALAARAILGTGDVMIFISVLRLIAAWFPDRQNPLMGQMATAVGIGCGSVASAAPLSTALRVFGWNATFLGTTLMGAAMIVVVLVWLRNNPAERIVPRPPGLKLNRRARHREDSTASRLSALRETWHEPGTRLGLWVHFTCQFPGNAFLLLWGIPFLTRGAGVETTTALRLLMLIAVSAVILGPAIGQTVGHFPRSRLPLALGIPLATLLTGAVVLAWPARHPLWLLILLAVTLGASNPGSMIGMDYARLHNPADRLGAAYSVVNIGGYSGTTIAVLGMGYIIDTLGPANAEAYRAALALFLPMLAIGLWKVIRWHRKVRPAGSTPCLAGCGWQPDLTSPAPRRPHIRPPIRPAIGAGNRSAQTASS
jgi:MFS family permease